MNTTNNNKKMLLKIIRDDLKSSSLSGREMEYSILVATGLADKQAADRMHISIHTANKHRSNIIKKMKFSSKLDIVRWTTVQVLRA